MEVFSMAALVALGMKLVSFLKYLRAQDWNEVTTQLIVWVAGVLVIIVAAAANITAQLEPFPGFTLGAMDFASKVLVGMAFLSAGSVVYDFRKARDNNDTAREPELLSGH